METSITAGDGLGSQIQTQNPQSAGQPTTGAVRADGLQQGTPTNALNKPGEGIPLTPNTLPSVSLPKGQATVAATQQPAKQVAQAQDVNPALIAIPGVLLVVVVVSIWLINRSAKTTTH